MSNIKFLFFSILTLSNILIASAINISAPLSQEIAQQAPVLAVFAALIITFSAMCYLGWWAYNSFAENLDPAGACITGFAIPVLTAFLATLNWSALSIIGRIQSPNPDEFMGRFDSLSLMMIFGIFMAGSLVWGALMKSTSYENRTQGNVAAGYTVVSYWFGFVMFSWVWMVMDRLI